MNKSISEFCEQCIRNTAAFLVRLIELSKNPETKQDIGILHKNLFRIAKQILPRKGKACIETGCGDPYETAKLFEALALFYPLYAGRIELTPRLDKRCFEAKADLRGRFCLIKLLFPAAHIFLNAKLKKLMGELS